MANSFKREKRIPKAADFQNRRSSGIFGSWKSGARVPSSESTPASKTTADTGLVLKATAAIANGEGQARRLRELIAKHGWNRGVLVYKHELLAAVDRARAGGSGVGESATSNGGATSEASSVSRYGP